MGCSIARLREHLSLEASVVMRAVSVLPVLGHASSRRYERVSLGASSRGGVPPKPMVALERRVRLGIAQMLVPPRQLT